jgi:hypothetical protein
MNRNHDTDIITKPEEVVSTVRRHLEKEKKNLNETLKSLRDSGVDQGSDVYQEALLKAREADRVIDNIDRVLRITECKIPGAKIPC